MVMVTEPIASGIYAGRTARIYSSPTELLADSDAGNIVDGGIFGFDSTGPYGYMSPDKSYAFVYGSDVGSVTLRQISLHELPDPGWVVNTVTGEVTSPDGTIYAFPVIPAWVIFCIKIAVATVAIVIIGSVIVAVIGAFRGRTISTSEQLSETTALISYPDGAGAVINKITGEVYSEEGPPLDWKWLIIIGIGTVGAIIVIQLLTRGRSSILELGEAGVRKGYGLGRRAYRKVMD